MANFQKLEQKIGEALGLEKAAQVAVEELSAKGLLDEGGMKDKLQNMKKQANNHQANLEELIPSLESEEKKFGTKVKAILAEEKRHLQLCTRLVNWLLLVPDKTGLKNKKQE